MRHYCINLRRRPDRWARMTAVAGAAGIELTRIEAVDAADAANEAAIAAMPRTGPTGTIGRAPVACTLSHCRAWETFLADPDAGDVAVILEDDVELATDFAAVTRALFDSANCGFPLVKLEAAGALADGAVLGRPRSLTPGRALHQSFQVVADAGAYALTRAAAAQLLSGRDGIRAGVDHYLFYPRKARGFAGLGFAVVVPPVARQDRALGSDLGAARYTDRKWQRDLRRVVYEGAQIGMILRAMLGRGARILRTEFRAEPGPTDENR